MTKRSYMLYSILLIVGFCLSACSEDIITTHYTIFRDSEMCYLQSTIDIQQINTNSGNMIANLETPVFSSIQDMQQRIKTGNIPEEQLTGLLSYLKLQSASEDADTFEICDPDKLYDVMLPDGLILNNISWSGATYLFSIKSNSELHGFIQYCTADSYVEKFNTEYINTLNESQIILSESVADDQLTRTVHYKNSTGRYQEIYYPIDVPDGTLYIREHFALDYYGNPDRSNISSTTPDFIHIFGIRNGAYFYGWFTDFEQRPDTAWLSDIGLQEYGWKASTHIPNTKLKFTDNTFRNNEKTQESLYFTETTSVELWIPANITISEIPIIDVSKIQSSTNAQLNITTYKTAAEYEKRLADYDPPALTYTDELYYGPQYGPHNLYIDWYQYINSLPNIQAFLLSDEFEDLQAEYIDEEWCMYQLPSKDGNGSWLVSNLLPKEELENVLQFVDWLYSDASV